MAQIGVVEHFCDFTQQMQVLLIGMFRHEQGENHLDVLPVGGVERDVSRDPDERAQGVPQPFQAAMGQRETVAESGGSQFFTIEQRVEDLAARNLVVVFEKDSDLLEQAFFAGDVEPQQHVARIEKTLDRKHGRAVSRLPGA